MRICLRVCVGENRYCWFLSFMFSIIGLQWVCVLRGSSVFLLNLGGTLLVGSSLQISNSDAVEINMVSAPRSTGLRDVLYTTGHKLPNPFCPSHICPYCSTVCYPMTPGSSLTRPKKTVIVCPAPRQQGHNITILTSSTNTRPTEFSSLTCIQLRCIPRASRASV